MFINIYLEYTIIISFQIMIYIYFYYFFILDNICYHNKIKYNKYNYHNSSNPFPFSLMIYSVIFIY